MLQLSSSLEKNLAALNARFGASADFYAKRIELYHCPGAIVLFDNMASLESLWSLLLDAATRHTPSLEPERMPHSGTQVYELLMHHSGLPAEDGPVKDMDDLIRRMTAGMAVLLLDGCKKGLVFSVQGLKSRSVEEPSGEGNLRGSREGFADLLRVNLSLLRRLIRTDTLVMETAQADCAMMPSATAKTRPARRQWRGCAGRSRRQSRRACWIPATLYRGFSRPGGGCSPR